MASGRLCSLSHRHPCSHHLVDGQSGRTRPGTTIGASTRSALGQPSAYSGDVLVVAGGGTVSLLLLKAGASTPLLSLATGNGTHHPVPVVRAEAAHAFAPGRLRSLLKPPKFKAYASVARAEWP